MKEKYLEELRNELLENGFENPDIIVEKYRKRYDFGLESEMSEDEIEERLGTPKSIVEKEIGESEDPKVVYDNKADSDFKIDISSVSDDVLFEESNDDEIHLYMTDIDEESYEVINDDRQIYIKNLKHKFFGLNRRRPGIFTVALPKNTKLSKLILNSTSGDFKSKINIDTKLFDLKMVSGDAEFLDIKSKDVIIHVVSGDAEINEITASDVKLSSVSGDIDVDYVLANTLKIDTVSGDIKVLDASNKMNINTSSVSGSIVISGNKYKSFTTKVKEVFKGDSKEN